MRPDQCSGDGISGRDLQTFEEDEAVSRYIHKVVDEKLESIGITKLAPLSDLEKAQALFDMAMELVALRRVAKAARAIIDYEWGDRPVPATQTEWQELLRCVLLAEERMAPPSGGNTP